MYCTVCCSIQQDLIVRCATHTLFVKKRENYLWYRYLPISMSSVVCLKIAGAGGYNLIVSFITLSKYFISFRSLIVGGRSDP